MMFQSDPHKFVPSRGSAQHAGRAADEARRAAIAIGLFAIVIAALGGSSKPDVVQLIALRPLAILAFLPVLLWLGREDLDGLRVPLALLGALAGWMALQLVPLPPAIWTQLPTRETIAQIDALIGIEGAWRPIHLVPTRGWNALAGLAVPAAALLLALAVRAPVRLLLQAIAGIGVANAVLGIVQVVTGGDAALLFYSQVAQPVALGLFANENHAAMLCAVTLIVIARLAVDDLPRHSAGMLRMVYGLSFALVLVGALLTGSRAGLLLSVLALVVAGWLVVRDALRRQSRDARRTPQFWLRYRRLVLGGLGVLAGALVIAVLLLIERSPAAEGLLAEAAFEDLRWRLVPILADMARTYWLVGTGFGSFEEVYHLFEPTELMIPLYVNQAHNDWAQVVIEGGLPGVLILAGLIGWLGAAFLALWRAGVAARGDALACLAIAAILAAASLVDYPLRTPIFQVVAAWMVVVIARCVNDSSPAGTTRSFVRTS